MAVKLDILPVGPLQANCYILSDDGGIAVMVDPGGDSDQLIAQCDGLQLKMVLLTHGHVDHVAAACAVKAATGAPVWAHEADWEAVEHPHPYFAQMVGGVEPCTLDGKLEDGQEMQVGEIALRIMHTPGHSSGSVCIGWEGGVLTGDTLFAGSVGRTDLPGGSSAELMQSLRRMAARLAPETVIYPGHGPATTMAEELADNPFLQGL